MAIPTKTGDETPLQSFTRWLSDGSTWIGIFENQDLGHPDLGRRIALPYDSSLFSQATIGKTTAPDHRDIGLGWRYFLVAKLDSADDAVAWLERREERVR